MRIHGAAPACLTTVPYEDSEFERGSESELAVPGGRKFRLELSSVTKLGLDGTPIGSIFGLEYPMAGSSSRADLGDVGGSETTALIVGVAVGNTIISSSEKLASEPSEPYSAALSAGNSGSDELLEVGSSSHICGGELPVSMVEETSQLSPIECARTLLPAPWLKEGEDQVDVDGPGVSE